LRKDIELLHGKYINELEGKKTSHNGREGSLEKAQNNQKKMGDAARDPETTGPAENLREKAAKANSQDSSRYAT
jgi:hypothetical protein